MSHGYGNVRGRFRFRVHIRGSVRLRFRFTVQVRIAVRFRVRVMVRAWVRVWAGSKSVSRSGLVVTFSVTVTVSCQ